MNSLYDLIYIIFAIINHWIRVWNQSQAKERHALKKKTLNEWLNEKIISFHLELGGHEPNKQTNKNHYKWMTSCSLELKTE